MASKLKEEDLVLNIIVNGNKAQSEIGKVSRSLQDATSKGKALQAEQKKLEKTGQTNSRRYRELTQEIEKNNAVIKEQRTRLGELNQSLSLEDKTLAQLRKSHTQLRRLRDQSAPKSQQWKEYNQQLQAVSHRMDELRMQGERTSGVLSRMTGGIRGFFNSALGGIAAFTAVIAGARKATETFSEFDDVVADVMKTTNGTKEEVMSLNAELEKLDTRTSQNDLLGLARVGGKLGIDDMDELRGFVEATNQLVVALNEDLGGDVEGTVQAVGKLVDIFSVDEVFGYEQGLLKVGSAINELGAASTANEGYMVEFARRMAGVAPLAGLSVQQILGLGATLDQLGQTSEVSSTALSKLFLSLSKDAEKFAKYAKMPVNEFKDLLEKDFLQAFTRVLDGVRDNSDGINELASTLGDLGLDGGRVVGVLGSLANNTHILTEQVDLANDAFEKGTSLTDEYNIKNATAAAQLDKSRKEVTKFWRELGERLWPAITSGNNLLVIFLKILGILIQSTVKYWKVILPLTVAIVSYYTAVKIMARWEVITTSLMAAKRVVVISLNGLYALLTGNLTRAAAAQRLLNVAMSLNPIGIAIAGIIGLTYALSSLKDSLTAAEKAQKLMNDAEERAIESVREETERIDKNTKAVQDNTKHRSLRMTAVHDLRKIMPDVLKDYSDEEIMAGKATKAIEKHTAAIEYHAKIREKSEQIARISEENKRYLEPAQDGIGGRIARVLIGESNYEHFTKRSRKHYEDRIAIERKLIKDLANLNEEYSALQKQSEINEFVDGEVLFGGKSAEELEKEAKEREKALKAELEAAKKAYQEQLEAEGLFRKNQRDMTAEELEKLLQIQQAYQDQTDEINRKYQQTLTDTTNSAESELTRRALAEQKYRDSLLDPRDPKLIQEKEQHEARLKQAGVFGLDMENMTEQQKKALERLEAIHAENIGKIDAEAMRKAIQDRQHAFQEQLTELRIQNNEELAEIRTMEQAKAKLSETMSPEALNQIRSLNEAKKILQNQYQLEEEQMTRDHLEALSSLVKEVLGTEKWEGINLADQILSDDERKYLESTLRKLRDELAKLRGGDLTDNAEAKAAAERGKTDILGMTIDDWDELFDNLEQGKISIGQIEGAVNAAIQMWSQYNAMVAAGERRQLQQFEEANLRKKEELDRRLQAGAIGQENYNKQVEKLDADLDRKRAKIDHDQAKRERNVALMSAIVNTASAVTKALPNLFLAAIVGAMGALQVGTIMKTPLPSLSGREDGGYLVRRSQDGKVFDASLDPDRRGYVNKPTVIVGENGSEFVASAEAVANPSVKPILDIIDTAQRNGTISTLVLEKILPRSRELRSNVPGRQGGGSLNGSAIPTSTSVDLERLEETVDKATKVIDKLEKTIAKGITAEVSLLGKNGFYEKDQEYKNIQDSTNL